MGDDVLDNQHHASTVQHIDIDGFRLLFESEHLRVLFDSFDGIMQDEFD